VLRIEVVRTAHELGAIIALDIKPPCTSDPIKAAEVYITTAFLLSRSPDPTARPTQTPAWLAEDNKTIAARDSKYTVFI